MPDHPGHTPASDHAPDRDGDYFHIIQADYRPENGNRCGFVVTRLRDGYRRRIVVEADDSIEWFEFEVADGSEVYDPSVEPGYLTEALLDDTTETLKNVRHLNQMLDANIAVSRMLRPGRAN